VPLKENPSGRPNAESSRHASFATAGEAKMSNGSTDRAWQIKYVINCIYKNLKELFQLLSINIKKYIEILKYELIIIFKYLDNVWYRYCSGAY
jgi:hypothetical protein